MEERAADGGRWERFGAAATWALVVASAVPVLLVGEVARRVLSGALDSPYAGGDSEATPLSQRWVTLLWSVSLDQAALASALGVVVLAALVVADRPRALVPTRVARLGAAAVGVLTTVFCLVVLLGTLAYLGRTVSPEDEFESAFGSSDLLITGPVVGITVVALVLAATATAVLLRPPADRRGEPLEAPEEAPPAVPASSTPDGVERSGSVQAAHRPTTLHTSGTPAAMNGAAPHAASAEPSELPTVAEEDLARYRRSG